MNRTVTSNTGPFKYWGNRVKIGGNEYGKPLMSIVDEVKLFNYQIDSFFVDVLAHECHFGPEKPSYYNNF